MLQAMRPITKAQPIDAAVNTHGNGDHCFGNEALGAQVDIYATPRAVEEMHVPDASTVFTGDILLIDGTPIMWAGPVSNWIAACDRIIDLDARTLVPGHGPVTDNSGVRDVKRYLEYVRD